MVWVVPNSISGLFMIDFGGFGRPKKGNFLWRCGVITLLWRVLLERNRTIFDDKEEHEMIWKRISTLVGGSFEIFHSLEVPEFYLCYLIYVSLNFFGCLLCYLDSS